MRKGWRIFLALIGLLIVGALAGFVIWGETPAQPMPEALDAIQSDAQVIVTAGGWLVFMPAASQPDTGFVIYPGGRVDPRAYAPKVRQIAEQGYLVVIVDMPLNLAVFNPGAAEKVIAAYPSRPLLPADTTWVSIDGGNHAQFGWYGDQAGDNPAVLSRNDQQAKVLAATLALLENLK